MNLWLFISCLAFSLVSAYLVKVRYGAKIRLLWRLWNMVPTSQATHHDTFSILTTELAAKINYQRHHHQASLYVPFDRRKVAIMSQLVFELLKENGESQELTQQPGLPYLVTARMLGGIGIRVTNLEDEISYTYDEETAPMYGEQVYSC